MLEDLKGYRQDIDRALEYWRDVISGFDVKYAYAKGSAIKNWDTIIDYVPLVSDLDIHFAPKRPLKFDIENSIQIMLDYEEFMTSQSALHVPRIQLISLHDRKDQFVPPTQLQIRPLLNQPELEDIPETEEFRAIDRKNVLDLIDYLESMHERALENTGVEVWRRIREVTWRVSPSPVRLLSQFEEPHLVWTWNRTNISQKLRKFGFKVLAEEYEKFYHLGWDYYHTGLKDTRIGLEMYLTAYKIIKSTIDEIHQLD